MNEMECVLMNTILSTLPLPEAGAGAVLDTLIRLGFFILLALVIYYLFQIGNRHVETPKKLHYGVPQMKLTFFILLGILILWWIVTNRDLLIPIIVPFVVAGVLAYAFNPLVKKLMSLKLSRTLSTAVIFIGIVVAVVGFSLVFFPMMVKELNGLVSKLPDLSQNWYEKFIAWYEGSIGTNPNMPSTFEGVLEYLNIEVGAITDWFFKSSGTLFSKIGSFASSLVHVVTVPVIMFYFMKDGDKIGNGAKKMVLPRMRNWVFPLAEKIDGVLGGFIRGQLLVAFFIGVLSAIALLILGVEYWLILGMLAGIGDLIPYIGPFLGAIPAVFIALTTDPWKAVWVIVAFLIIQQLEGNLISPKIVGHSVGLHPALIIFVLLIGGALWGLVGLLVAVPLAGVIKVLLETILQWFKEHYPTLFEAS